MSDAFVETTVLTDLLLKSGSPKQERAKRALARYGRSLLPVYSIKEFKAGPLSYFAYTYDKLVITGSFRKTFVAIASLAPGYRQSSSIEALAAAAERAAGLPVGSSSDEELADRFRYALAKVILGSWVRRRKVTTAVVEELDCYTEAAPRLDKDGLFELRPTKCERDQECCLSERLKGDPDALERLRKAVPQNSQRREDVKRRQALKQLIKKPHEPLDRDTCRALGDAVFAFLCPAQAVILTTNIRDHEPLAAALGKVAEKP